MRGPMIMLVALSALSFAGLYALGPMECGHAPGAAASDMVRRAPARRARVRAAVAPAAPAADASEHALASAPEGPLSEAIEKVSP